MQETRAITAGPTRRRCAGGRRRTASRPASACSPAAWSQRSVPRERDRVRRRRLRREDPCGCPRRRRGRGHSHLLSWPCCSPGSTIERLRQDRLQGQDSNVTRWSGPSRVTGNGDPMSPCLLPPVAVFDRAESRRALAASRCSQIRTAAKTDVASVSRPVAPLPIRLGAKVAVRSQNRRRAGLEAFPGCAAGRADCSLSGMTRLDGFERHAPACDIAIKILLFCC